MNKLERTNLSRRLFHAVMLLVMLLGMLMPTSAQAAPQFVAGDELPQGIPPNPKLKDKIKQGKVKLPRHMTDPAWAASVGIEGAGAKAPQAADAPQAAPPTGTIKMLAVAVDFSDNVHTVTASYFDSLLFALPVAGPGSMRDYYNEISYGQIDFVTLNLPSAVGWQRAPQTYAYYVNHDYGEGTYPNNAQKLAEDVIDAIAGVIDFSKYDNDGDGNTEPIVLIHAGQGAESSGSLDDLWSFSWSITSANARHYDGVTIRKFTVQPEYADVVTATTSDQTMGVYAHEVAHGFFGVPDTYDTDYTSNGVGDFDLMAGGSWGGPNGGDVPAWPSAWIRKQMGIVTPVSITANATGRSLAQVYNNNVDPVLKLSSSALGSQEYFLIENRQKATGTYDQYIPAGGLLIWHIDEAMPNNTAECSLIPQSGCSDTAHYRVALMQADGLFDMEKKVNGGDAGDPFPGSTSNRNWATSTVPETSSYYAAGATCINVTNISNSAATMTADLRVVCNATNTPPVAVDDSYTTAKNTAVTIAVPGVLKNDTDVDWSLLTASKLTDPAHGTVTFNANGSFTYTPTANWIGTDSFTYKANDGTADSNVATVTMAVLDTGMVALSSDTSKCMTVIGTDPTTAPYMTMSACVGTPQQLWTHDSVSGQWRTALNPNYCVAANSITTTRLNLRLCTDSRALTLEPNPTEAGSWRAVGTTYVIDLTRWLFGGVSYPALSPYTTNRTSEVLTWLPSPLVNTAPVAVNDNYSTNENTTLTIAAPGVLSNDTDAERNPLTAVKVSEPAHGSLTLNANGSFTYTPAANYSGADSFTYKANDGSLDSNIATVNITVVPNEYTLTVNSAHGTVTKSPNKPTYHYGEEVTLSVASDNGWTFTNWTPPLDANKVIITGNTTVTANFTQNEYTLTVLKVGNGTVTRDNNGPYHLNDVVTLTAVADEGWTFTGWIPALTDNKVTITGDTTVTANFAQNEYTLTVLKVGNGTVTRDNNGPYHLNDVVTLAAVADAGWTFTGWTPALMDNKITITGDTTVTATFTQNEYPLTILKIGNGTVTRDNNGPYHLNDVVTLTAVADAGWTFTGWTPSLTDNKVTITGNTTVTANFAQNEYTLTVNSAHGTVTRDNNGPYHLNDVVTLTVVADAGWIFTGWTPVLIDNKVTITGDTIVTANFVVSNTAPVATNDSYTTDQDTALTIAAPGVLGNDTDADGNALTAVLVDGPSHGMLTLDANGSFIYTPAAGYSGADSFKYKANDSQADSDIATVSITVNHVNHAPTVVDDTTSTTEGTPVTINALFNDSDPDGDTLSVTAVGTPVHGSVVINPDYTLTYTPASLFNGTDEFTYTVSDGNGGTATAKVTVTVGAVNDVPTAGNDIYTTDEDTQLTIAAPGVLTNDNDPDGDAITAVLVTNVGHGTLVLHANGFFTYIPSANFNGSDSLTYKANDGHADSNIATVSITVNPINDAPVANSQSLSVDEDSSLAIALTGSDVDGDALIFSVIADPAHGTLSGTAPDLTYTPNANFNGTDGFTFKVSDGFLEAQAQINITVNPINDAPIAVLDAYETDENAPLDIAAPGVLANDTDVDGDVLTAVLVSSVSHGTLVFNPNGSFTYTPETNFNGEDSFTYTANDGVADSNGVTGTIKIHVVNYPPSASNDTYNTDEDTALTIAAPGLLGNDTDADDDALSALKATDPSHGTLTLNADGSFTYTSDANWHGTDTFTYKATDGIQESNSAEVTIVVKSIKDAPIATAQSVSLDEDLQKAITLTGSDVDGETLTYTIVTMPANGVLSGTAPNISYTPNANFYGDDSLTFTVNDGHVTSDPATVNIHVNSVNDAPVCLNLSLTTDEDTTSTLSPSCTDVDNAVLSYQIVAAAGHGTASISGGLLAYSPDANYNGTDAFTYKANDGVSDSNTADVAVTVNPIDDAPVANNQSVTTDQNTPKAITLAGSDVEGSPLTFTIVTGPTHGSLSGTAPSITYTPASGYSGSDSFTFKVNDGALDSNIATVSITVAASNHMPVAVNDSYTASANTALIVTTPGILGNDTDADSDLLTAIKVSSPAHGTLTLNANGSFTYIPDSGYVGSDSFTYKANDGKADSNIATVTVTVKYNFTGFFSPVDNLPVINQVKAGQGIPVKFSLGGNMGLSIFAAGYPTSKQVACTSGVPVDQIEETSNSNGGLTFDATTGQYDYVWKTQKTWSGTCRQFTLRLIDGTEILALFKFK